MELHGEKEHSNGKERNAFSQPSGGKILSVPERKEVPQEQKSYVTRSHLKSVTTSQQMILTSGKEKLQSQGDVIDAVLGLSSREERRSLTLKSRELSSTGCSR